MTTTEDKSRGNSHRTEGKTMTWLTDDEAERLSIAGGAGRGAARELQQAADTDMGVRIACNRALACLRRGDRSWARILVQDHAPDAAGRMREGGERCAHDREMREVQS